MNNSKNLRLIFANQNKEHYYIFKLHFSMNIHINKNNFNTKNNIK